MVFLVRRYFSFILSLRTLADFVVYSLSSFFFPFSAGFFFFFFFSIWGFYAVSAEKIGLITLPQPLSASLPCLSPTAINYTTVFVLNNTHRPSPQKKREDKKEKKTTKGKNEGEKTGLSSVQVDEAFVRGSLLRA